MAVILTGASGRLGSELRKLYPKALCPRITTMDVADRTSVIDYMAKHKPTLVIHCAAYTEVSYCEDDPEDAYYNNSIGTWNIAKYSFGAKIVYISTDHVFDGKVGLYSEVDVPNPTTVYGKSKLIGEWFTLSNPKNLVIRTSFMKDFPFEKAYKDKYFNAEPVPVIAKMIKQAIDMNLAGLYHIAGKPKNVYQLAKRFKRNVKPMLLSERPTNENGLPYLRDTTLDIEKWKYAKRTYRRKHKLQAR